MSADGPGTKQPSLVEIECPYCDGRGFDVGHEDGCYEGNGCACGGVQIWCQACGGQGSMTVEEHRG